MPVPLQWENLLKFLADTDVNRIVELVSDNTGRLSRVLRRNYARRVKYPRLEPDTIEAADAAAAESGLWDLAEERVAELRAEAPDTWEAMVRLIPTMTEEISASDMRRL
jgi:hypothetical protein